MVGGGSGSSGGHHRWQWRRRSCSGRPRASERRFAKKRRTAVPRFSVYATAPNYEKIDRDTTEFEVGYDSDVVGGTIGADVLIKNAWVVGMAFDYKRWKGDYNSGGDFDTDIYRPIIYASFFPVTGLFADVFLSYAWNDVSDDRLRQYTNEADDTFGGNISSKPDTEEFKVGVSLGYDYPFRQFTVGPRLSVDYLSADFDSFREKGISGLELEYDKDSRVSFQSKLGLQASMPISTSFGVVVPQIRGDWIHEYSDNQRSVSVRFRQDLRDNPATFSFQTDEPDRDYFEISAGLLVALPQSIQVFGNYRTLQGHDFVDSYSATAGFRVEF